MSLGLDYIDVELRKLSIIPLLTPYNLSRMREKRIREGEKAF